MSLTPESGVDPSEVAKFPQENRKVELREQTLELHTGEKVILPSTLYDQLDLYHGSSVSNIRQFEQADSSTIGHGVYLTSSQDSAEGYAKVRSLDRGNIPTVYHVHLKNVNILNLTSRDATKAFSKAWIEYLQQWRVEQLPNLNMENELVGRIVKDNYNRLINEAIRQHRSVQDFWLRDVIQPGLGDIARQWLTRLGYDGLQAIEGGETSYLPSGEPIRIGDHDSFVIFDPAKVGVQHESTVTVDPTVGESPRPTATAEIE